MKKEINPSLIKIICVSIILLILSGIGVMAVSTQIENVKITLSNGYEMTVLTTKTKVSEILKDNNIILEESEKTIPDVNSEITSAKTIKITDKSEQEVQVAKISEEGVQTSLNEILKGYAPITEKIVKEQVAIPYETIQKEVTSNDDNSVDKVLQEGKEGIKEVTYRLKLQNETEIERTVISEIVIQEPVNKIVKKQKIATSRASTVSRTSSASGKTTAKSGVYKVTAYCSCSKCCGKRTGRTASGTKATAGRTVAASSKFSFGTKLKINGKTYVVEDRGGAVKGNKIDVYMSSHSAALRWGVRYLPVEVVE